MHINPHALQEVVRRTRLLMEVWRAWSRVKLQKGIVETIIKFHNSGLVTTAVAVIRRAKDSDHIGLVAPVVPLHYELMGARHQDQAVAVVEGLTDILPKVVACTARREVPARAIVWV